MESFRMAVVSDTHVPDRTPGLPANFLSALRSQKFDVILHAGDICVQSVLAELEKIAPVLAVTGNRDFLLRQQIPMMQRFDHFGVRFVLAHGHMNPLTYWSDKFLYVTRGYDRERYIRRLIAAVPDAKCFVFGHTHHAENFWQEGRLFFNPGSITYGDYLLHQRSWGILEVFEDGRVEGKIIEINE